MCERARQRYSARAGPTSFAKLAGFSSRASKSWADSASLKVSSFAGLPWESSPSSTKSRVLVTSTRRYLPQ